MVKEIRIVVISGMGQERVANDSNEHEYKWIKSWKLKKTQE